MFRLLAPLLFRMIPGGVVCAGLIGAATGCSSTADGCRAGEERACGGAGDCAGVQVCEGEPPAWGPCECAGGSNTAATSATLGARCDSDDDCEGGELCLGPGTGGYLGGAPPTGTCVADCSVDRDRCGSIHEKSVCVVTEGRNTPDEGDDRAFCFETCSLGKGGDAKCHGRRDLACDPLEEGSRAGFCRPFCTVDSECESGACDRRRGVCIDRAEETDGNSFGEPCDPQASEPGCEGICVEVDGEAFCSHRCYFGSPGDCRASMSEPQGALCVFASPRGSIGDVGFCGELCDCNADCTIANTICDPVGTELEEVVGRRGACVAREAADGGVREGIECAPAGDAGAPRGDGAAAGAPAVDAGSDAGDRTDA